MSTQIGFNRVSKLTCAMVVIILIYYVNILINYTIIEDWASAFCAIAHLWGFWIMAILLDLIRQRTHLITDHA